MIFVFVFPLFFFPTEKCEGNICNRIGVRQFIGQLFCECVWQFSLYFLFLRRCTTNDNNKAKTKRFHFSLTTKQLPANINQTKNIVFWSIFTHTHNKSSTFFLFRLLILSNIMSEVRKKKRINNFLVFFFFISLVMEFFSISFTFCNLVVVFIYSFIRRSQTLSDCVNLLSRQKSN